MQTASSNQKEELEGDEVLAEICSQERAKAYETHKAMIAPQSRSTRPIL